MEVAFDLNLEARVGFGRLRGWGRELQVQGRCLSELFSAHVEGGEWSRDLQRDMEIFIKREGH